MASKILINSQDLAQRSNDRLKGINKLTFSSYYKLPGIISERLFAVFDTSQNGYLNVVEFLEGMRTLFSENFEKTSNLIFNLYDFDKDGFISREDIRTVLQYVPLNKAKVSNIEGYKDRVESQEELHQILTKTFESVSNDKLDFNKFIQVIEHTCSDLFFYILIFLMEKKPFTNSGLSVYEKQKSPRAESPKKYESPPKMVVSPNKKTKFTPSAHLSRSPNIEKKSIDGLKLEESNEYINKLTGRVHDKSQTVKETQTPSLSTFLKAKEKEKEKSGKNSQVQSPLPHVNRKLKANLKNIEANVQPVIQIKNVYNDIPIIPAFKQTVKTRSSKPDINIIGSESSSMTANSTIIEQKTDFISTGIEGLTLNLCEKSNSSNSLDGYEEIVKHEGYLYKLTENKKVKKLWFKLYDRDLYFFKSQNDKLHKGMHNLSGVFLKEEKPQSINNILFYTFSVVYPLKVRYYYVDNELDYKIWVEKMKNATGYADLTEIYEIKEKLGNGKFGLVRLGVHKKTGQKVAIKIMTKKDMTTQDLELVRTEIEILKVCQHPNIIGLYEVFENTDYFYIIMEYCAGGDLFSYIERRGFRLPEQRTFQIIHKLCTAVFYAHSYGITHRDLKPENILMTDNSEQAEIKLLDFGLSKIIGPNENCNEPYGTLCYVSPEVLTEQPYTKAVDLWSIGVITYLLIAGCLPFDHETSEREIARMTIHDPVPYKGSIWSRTSPECKQFIDGINNIKSRTVTERS